MPSSKRYKLPPKTQIKFTDCKAEARKIHARPDVRNDVEFLAALEGRDLLVAIQIYREGYPYMDDQQIYKRLKELKYV